jgi:hypothetical protein
VMVDVSGYVHGVLVIGEGPELRRVRPCRDAVVDGW